MGKISKKKEGMRELALTQRHLEINLTIVYIIDNIYTIFPVSSDIQIYYLYFSHNIEGVYKRF